MKLKPCPFCGKEPELIEEWIPAGLHEGGYAWVVRCNYMKDGCGAKGGSRLDKIEAIKVWNKRNQNVR